MDGAAHNLALVLAFIIFWVGVKVHKWWVANHSPTDSTDPAGGVKPQVGPGLTPPDPTSGAAPGEGTAIYKPSSAVDTWLAQQAPGRGTNDVIREAVRRFGVSVSTVKRRLRKQRGTPQ